MAKIPFTKLKLIKKDETVTFLYNEQEVTVKKYLPVNEKLELIGRVINAAADENRFYNPVKLDIFLKLEIVFTYTNINFTDKQKEDPSKLYDLLIQNYLLEEIIKHIPVEEYEFLESSLEDIVDSIYQYQNSIFGILDTVSADYNNLNLDAGEIQQKLGDKDNLSLLREVLTKLG